MRWISIVVLATSCGHGRCEETRAGVEMRARIGSWFTFPAEGATRIALSGDFVAAAGPGHAVVWEGRRRALATDAARPAPGIPRLHAGRLFHGPFVVPLDGGPAEARREAMPEDRPDSARAAAYAWSARGDRLLASLGGSGAERARVLLVAGHAVETLWNESGVAPEALWVGDRAAAIGTSEGMRVYDAGGRALATLPFRGLLARIDAGNDETLLLTLELNRRVSLVRLPGGVSSGWDGAFVDAALAPGGAFAVAADLDGNLLAACIANDRFGPPALLAQVEGTTAVAVSEGRIAVLADGVVKRASLAISCP